ncbi:MAG: sulfatase [Planctomycetota bacterium]
MKSTLGLFSLLCLTATAAATPPKNIVLILADDLGWADTTLYGKTALFETPNIERLAARGMTFSSAYASPICSPTRASIMTGQNPARHGMTAPAAHLEAVRFEAVASDDGPPHQKCTNVRSSTRLDPGLPFLSQVLQGAGYSTAHFGKWHLGREPHSPLERGFDVDLPHWWGPGPKTSYLAPWGYENPSFKEGEPGDHIEDRMAQEAVRWLKNRDRSKPFFMNYWQFSVHAPFGAKPELIDHYRKKLGASVAGLSRPEVREKLLNPHEPGTGLPQQSPTYAAMVHSLDDAVGTLLDALQEEGIVDDTIIIFYSDNGGNIHCGLEETASTGEKYITPITSNHPLRGGKGGIHEGGVRVPAVVVWPGVTTPGSHSDVRIQAIDLYPTILHMLNVERPSGHVIDGIDFVPALRGEDMDRGPMFTHVPGHGGTPHWLPPSMSVHDGDWKLIRTFHYGKDGKHQYRLFNLREDIGETTNLASNHPEKVQELDKLIENYITELNVVVPLPNPSFDATKFDPAKIGVQPGGLKMPPSFKSSQAKSNASKPSKPVNDKSMLGWIARNAAVSVAGESLRVTPTGRQSFIASAKVRVDGPAQIKLRVRTKKKGTGRLQWRTADQDTFPKSGQTHSFVVAGGEWQELSVPLDGNGRLVHVRLFLPGSKRPTEIDWIEIGPMDGNAEEHKRWDFGVRDKNGSVPWPSRNGGRAPVENHGSSNAEH